MVAIIDYGTGNLRSVENALRRVRAAYTVTSCESAIRLATHVILPGVGEAGSAMAALREKGLDRIVPSLTRPVLGICIGMQLMCRRSEEGATDCLGIFDAVVARLTPSAGHKVPHVGWDTIGGLSSPLMAGIPEGEYVYYVHSYAPGVCRHTIASTVYGAPMSAALGNGNFYGTQFHPEKSGAAGEKILKNFLSL